MSTIGEVIEYVANKYQINVILALADAWVESACNPNAVGDNGTSVGIYQLHRGGELGDLTKEQAFDPLTNAEVALSHFAAVRAVPRKGAALEGGALAAAAQRPADPGAYALKVNQVISAINDGSITSFYTQALAKETSVSITDEGAARDAATAAAANPPPVTEPEAEADLAKHDEPTEIAPVDSAIDAQVAEVKADTDAGKAGKAREVLAKLKVHLQELEVLLSTDNPS